MDDAVGWHHSCFETPVAVGSGGVVDRRGEPFPECSDAANQSVRGGRWWSSITA